MYNSPSVYPSDVMKKNMKNYKIYYVYMHKSNTYIHAYTAKLYVLCDFVKQSVYISKQILYLNQFRYRVYLLM